MRRNAGFTVIELVFVILIGSILVGVAISSVQNAQTAVAARGAKNMYATLHQRARTRAVELGQTALLYVDTVGDSALIISDGQITDITRFREQLNVDLRVSGFSAPSTFFLCMTPRGFADPDCPAWGSGVSISNVLRLEFWMNNRDSTSVVLLPLGQLVGL